jgi:hypothetical protein
MAANLFALLGTKSNMNIGADEKQHIARLISFLLCGEKVAHHCSARQAKLCDDTQMKHFLLRQSRQEMFHAVTFQSAILLLAPKGVSTPAEKQMLQYDTLLNYATSNHDLHSSVIGLQVILEGMGDIALSHLDHGIKQRSLGFNKVRRAILNQEDTHHEFGLSFIESNDSLAKYPNHTEDYLSLINDMLTSLHGLFDFFDEDSSDYMAEFIQKLPEQLHNDALRHHTST